MINSTNTSTAIPIAKCPVCGKQLFVAKDGSSKECRECGYLESVLPFIPNTDGPKESAFGLYGWICPKCGAVMSPYESFCPNCTKRNWEITCTTTGTADISKQSNIHN